MRQRWALILGHNRQTELWDVVYDIEPQVDKILIIDNASSPPITAQEGYFDKIFIFRDPAQPANLSRLWNQGLNWIEDGIYVPKDDLPTWNVAILTDDVRIPSGWFDAVQDAMDRHGCVAGCSSPWPQFTQEIVKREPDHDIMNRMYGPAFILRGETGLRADESMHWWFNDTDLDWQARKAGGMVVVPGYSVTNLYPNASTVGELAEQAGRDRGTFAVKWGGAPW